MKMVKLSETPNEESSILEAVARQFLTHYYNLLAEKPEAVINCYSDSSSIKRFGNEVVKGLDNIKEELIKHRVENFNVRIFKTDCLYSLNGSIVLQVSGLFIREDNYQRAFLQNFVLGSQGPRKFYIHTDLLEWLDELYPEVLPRKSFEKVQENGHSNKFSKNEPEQQKSVSISASAPTNAGVTELPAANDHRPPIQQHQHQSAKPHPSQDQKAPPPSEITPVSHQDVPHQQLFALEKPTTVPQNQQHQNQHQHQSQQQNQQPHQSQHHQQQHQAHQQQQNQAQQQPQQAQQHHHQHQSHKPSPAKNGDPTPAQAAKIDNRHNSSSTDNAAPISNQPRTWAKLVSGEVKSNGLPPPTRPPPQAVAPIQPALSKHQQHQAELQNQDHQHSYNKDYRQNDRPRRTAPAQERIPTRVYFNFLRKNPDIQQSVIEEDVKKAFGKYGEVDGVNINFNTEYKFSNGHVDFKEETSVRLAFDAARKQKGERTGSQLHVELPCLEFQGELLISETKYANYNRNNFNNRGGPREGGERAGSYHRNGPNDFRSGGGPNRTFNNGSGYHRQGGGTR